MFLYMIKHKENNKVYIGYTTQTNIQKYWHSHFYNARTKRGGNRYFYNAIRVYGEDAFECSVLAEFDTLEEAKQAEIYTIAKYKSNICKYGKEFGYNMTDGGEGVVGVVQSQETIAKRVKAITGKKRTKEQRQRMSERATGRKHTDETKKKLSKITKGRKSNWYGHTKIDFNTAEIIREEYKSGKITQKQLGLKHEVSQHTIGQIIKYKTCKENIAIPQDEREKIRHIDNTNKNTIKSNRCGKTKLNIETAEIIRQEYSINSNTYEKLGLKYGVSQGTISNIILNKTCKKSNA